jgi:hypothetical protein
MQQKPDVLEQAQKGRVVTPHDRVASNHLAQQVDCPKSFVRWQYHCTEIRVEETADPFN